MEKKYFELKITTQNHTNTSHLTTFSQISKYQQQTSRGKIYRTRNNIIDIWQIITCNKILEIGIRTAFMNGTKKEYFLTKRQEYMNFIESLTHIDFELRAGRKSKKYFTENVNSIEENLCSNTFLQDSITLENHVI